MIDIGSIQRDVVALDSLKGEEKLQAAKRAYARIEAAERECARDFSVPYDIVKSVRELIPGIQATVNRLEAGARKRAENKAAPL